MEIAIQFEVVEVSPGLQVASEILLHRNDQRKDSAHHNYVFKTIWKLRNECTNAIF